MQGNSNEARTILKGLLHDKENQDFYKAQAEQWLRINDDQFHATVAETIAYFNAPAVVYQPPQKYNSGHVICKCNMCQNEETK